MFQPFHFLLCLYFVSSYSMGESACDFVFIHNSVVHAQCFLCRSILFHGASVLVRSANYNSYAAGIS